MLENQFVRVRSSSILKTLRSTPFQSSYTPSTQSLLNSRPRSAFRSLDPVLLRAYRTTAVLSSGRRRQERQERQQQYQHSHRPTTIVGLADAPAASQSTSLLIRPRCSPLIGRKFVPLDPVRRFSTIKLADPTTNKSSAPLAHRTSTSIPPLNNYLATSSALSPTIQRTQQLSRHLVTTAAEPDKMSYSKTPSEYTTRYIGPKNTLDFRAYLEKDGQPVSPFHDIPLFANEQQTVLNMIVEIPRWSNAKLEVRLC